LADNFVGRRGTADADVGKYRFLGNFVKALEGRDRLIVALDVPTADEAVRLMTELEGSVSFYKVGLQLLLAGGWERVAALVARKGGSVFLDTKLPDDIPNTIASAVRACTASKVVKLLTLSGQVTPRTVAAAREGRGGSPEPRLLVVPYLSSMDASDLAATDGPPSAADVNELIVRRGREAVAAGCDGVVVSGDAIAAVRASLPDVVIVSPGIRPRGSSADDQKRVTTPADAIRMGADYLVVGRPILRMATAEERRRAAQAVIDEIDNARRARHGAAH
jgi:orotidine-5'-phosphate decarboxylase